MVNPGSSPLPLRCLFLFGECVVDACEEAVGDARVQCGLFFCCAEAGVECCSLFVECFCEEDAACGVLEIGSLGQYGAELFECCSCVRDAVVRVFFGVPAERGHAPCRDGIVDQGSFIVEQREVLLRGCLVLPDVVREVLTERTQTLGTSRELLEFLRKRGRAIRPIESLLDCNEADGRCGVAVAVVGMRSCHTGLHLPEDGTAGWEIDGCWSLISRRPQLVLCVCQQKCAVPGEYVGTRLASDRDKALRWRDHLESTRMNNGLHVALRRRSGLFR